MLSEECRASGNGVVAAAADWGKSTAAGVHEVMRQLRFLIVDDTEDLRSLMVRMVERAGHMAEEAEDGVEAIAALSTHRYDVMLLDLSMPRMGGEDVVRWLNANPHRAEGLRIVVVTAWGGERRGSLQELGVRTVLAKPFRLQQMTDLIAEVAAEVLS